MKVEWHEVEVITLIKLTIGGYCYEQEKRKKPVNPDELAKLIYQELNDRKLIQLKT